MLLEPCEIRHGEDAVDGKDGENVPGQDERGRCGESAAHVIARFLGALRGELEPLHQAARALSISTPRDPLDDGRTTLQKFLPRPLLVRSRCVLARRARSRVRGQAPLGNRPITRLAMEPFSFPFRFFLCLPPLLGQCILLQPSVSSGPSRAGRFVLGAIVLWLALLGPTHQVLPVERSIMCNVALGLATVYAVWKAVEWGTVQDRTVYEWVGFPDKKDGEDETEARGATNGEAIRQKADKTPDELKKSTRRDERSSTLVSALHLLVSMRGHGYRFCVTPTTTPYRTVGTFLPHVLFTLLWSHLVVLSCVSILLPSQTTVALHLSTYLSLPTPTSVSLAAGLQAIALGTMAWSGLRLGYAVVALLFLYHTVLLRLLLPASIRPRPFDPRQYPLLIRAPWGMRSVTSFWSTHWHDVFTRSFRFLAFLPSQRILGQTAGRIVGTMLVFLLSAVLHQHGDSVHCRSNELMIRLAISLAMHRLPARSLPWVVQQGSTIYFLAQGVAILLEGFFYQATGRKVAQSGLVGKIWTYAVVGGMGSYLATSW